MSQSKLQQLISRCKGPVHVTCNDHRAGYIRAEEEMDNLQLECAPDVMQKIVETQTLIHIQFYPDTPIGFYVVAHYDIEAALDRALAILDASSE
jgi:hypothetical protein